jgi:hypothetical protein
MLKAFHHHWPEGHPEQFYDAAEFRAWAQMKCGHYRIAQRIPLSQAGPLGAVSQRERLALVIDAAFRSAGTYAWSRVVGNDLVIYVPKSIAYDKLSHGDATRLFGDVESFLESETGLDAHQVMAEHQNAA